MNNYLKLYKPKKIQKFKTLMLDVWEIDNKIVEKTLNNHSDKIKKYSMEHYMLMYELINKKIKKLSKKDKIAYITCKKLKLKNDGNKKPVFIAINFYLFLFNFSLSKIESWIKLLFLVIITFLECIYVYVCGTPKYKFYIKILDNIMDKINNKENKN